MEQRLSGRRSDALVAVALAAVLGVAWTVSDWASLRLLRLPDTDDVMRLQQVRDWLGGQGFADLTQHRLGAGVPMHWTRLADLAPAAGVAALTPLVGRHAAELASVVAWPLLLFALALFLVARIARALGGRALAATAAVVASVAFPATTIFAPGRIDHHGLQMVLLLAAMLAAVRPPSQGSGFAVGIAAAASLVVGLETAPLMGTIGLAAVAAWIGGGRDAEQRLVGLGIGALAGLAIGRGIFAPQIWDYAGCDGFDAPLWRAAVPLAAVPLMLGLAPVAGRARRLGAAGAAAGGAAALALWLSPACLHPYGAVDPLLARTWLAAVGEAQPLWAAPSAVALGYVGVAAAGLIASGWRWRVSGASGWALLAAVQLVAFAVTTVQLRGAYAGALLAAPGLAAVIAAARARGLVPLAGAWAASAGMLYPLAAEAITPAGPGQRDAGGSCTAPALIARLAALPAGVVMAPIDTGAWAIPATPHRLIAGPYHRNNAGNLAALRFYAGPPREGAAIAAAWRADYLLVCGAMPGAREAGTNAAALAARIPAGWRVAIAMPDGARILSRR